MEDFMGSISFHFASKLSVNAKVASSINGAGESILKGGNTIIVFPTGDSNHLFGTIKAPAFQAFVSKNPEPKWIGVKPFRFGLGSKDIPGDEDVKITKSDSGYWCISDGRGSGAIVEMGLAANGLVGAFEEETENNFTLKGAILIEVEASEYVYQAGPIPATAATAAKAFSTSKWFNNPQIGEPTNDTFDWNKSRWWVGKARWATEEDLREHLLISAELLSEASAYLKK